MAILHTRFLSHLPNLILCGYFYFPVLQLPKACPKSPGETYRAQTLSGPDTNRPINPTLNLSQRELVQINGPQQPCFTPKYGPESQRSSSRRERSGLSCIPDHRPTDKSTNRSPSAAPDAAACQTGSADVWPEGLQIRHSPLPHCSPPPPPLLLLLRCLRLSLPTTDTAVMRALFVLT